MQRVQPATAGNPGPSSTNPTTTSRGANQDWNAEDLQKVVLENLTKKGFHKAETLLRLEASQMQEASAVGEGYRKLTDPFFGSSSDAYELLRRFIQQSLDIYKTEMARILWPTFAYLFMDLLAEGKTNAEKIDEGILCLMLYD
jgi:transcription initiation factor TFIID subunit 5